MNNIKGKFKINANVENFSKDGYVLFPFAHKDSVNSACTRLKEKLAEILGKSFDLRDYHQYVQDDDQHFDIQLELLEFLPTSELHSEILVKNLDIVESLMGPDIEVQSSPHLRIARPGKKQDNIGFHSDIDYGNTSYEMSCIIALTQTDEAGALMILPTSHAQPLFKTIAIVNEKAPKGSKLNRLGVPYTFKKIIDEGYKEGMVPIPMNVGELLFFNLGLVHGQEVNNSSSTRWSIDCRLKNIHAPTNTRQGYYKSFSKSPLTQAAEKFLENNKDKKI